MKIWLDDTRQPPDASWVWVTTAEEVLWEIVNGPGSVNELSVDHDLGLNQDGKLRRTGYDLLVQLEEYAHDGNWRYVPELIRVHSANPVGRYKMQKAIDSIVNFKLRSLTR